MASNSSSGHDVRTPSLTPSEIDKILSMTLIANLATLGEDDTIHIVPMWFIRLGNDICIPTSRHTRKYKNLKARPYASVMIDISREGLDLKGALIRGPVELVEGEEARKINHQIHLKYVTEEGLNDPSIASYLSKGDDVTVRIHMEHIVNWNLADSKAGKALRVKGRSRQLDA
ncbi:MAG: pyridoxamine 5'-phosphate oxidase family protein [Nitrososphaeraceae archaeon]|jgi:nitroimidazol reductase NimA-like FMN-containing flavoprotein (pyridoxamine 5'-phosphate oxidase superfamily)|nr:pyridoxamine 5'-phosphate oxidase family protein [Nitrososphaeraceae archaeon]MDW0216669.1 pyridoxamine 5'-phosphate oxidase family protein [Nitrososphaeraceae archaeon]MDW0242821.1 pyridoxamine 5'-phosphate oxidase family protein [Nitrososphaeraceae archaeon]MDW0331006.1 pyridoxamine 5'-phosphate oxidase family protein [Nitrososphaeraceae archaeon]MDW3667213.1 pyridoxamine 5'-phosphate oxidase family protein [Nitrososphaeraceae archaeon]